MRIDPNVVISPIAREPREPQAPAAEAGDTPSSVVKLSSAGSAAAADPSGAAPTTTSRLQVIRAMLDKGDYPVDLDLLATRIVDDELLRSGPP